MTFNQEIPIGGNPHVVSRGETMFRASPRVPIREKRIEDTTAVRFRDRPYSRDKRRKHIVRAPSRARFWTSQNDEFFSIRSKNTNPPERGFFLGKKLEEKIMFTGIIINLGKLRLFKQSKYTFVADTELLQRLKKGGSIAVDGVCLTVVENLRDAFSVEIIPETLERTTLGTLQTNDLVNLELPMSPQSLFEGHIVQGHVDGAGFVETIKEEGNSRLAKIKVSPELSRYMIEKGSVAVSGVALTIIDAEKDFFTVGIIPHTWKNTTFQSLKIGDGVNIEVDMIAKYVEKFITKYQ